MRHNLDGVIFKKGVVFSKDLMHPNLMDSISKVRFLYEAMGQPMTITSARDERHSAKSLHWKGMAIDTRTRDLTAAQQTQLRKSIAEELGADFDVVLESDHIHIEYDPD